MKRTAYVGLALLMASALASTAFGQVWKGTEDYNGYMAVYQEKDPVKKAAAGEKFLVDFKDADPIARQNAYVMTVFAYYEAKNWAKVIESVDKQAQLGPTVDANTKKQFLMMAQQGAGMLKNNVKIKEYAEKVLATDPNEINALVALSGLLSTNLPADEAARNTQIAQALEINARFLKQPKPAGVADTVWLPLQVQFNRTSCLLLLNQKKYPETIAACQEALKIDKKDGDSYYLIGLAMKPAFAELVKKYEAAVNTLNENRSADQITRDDMKAVADGALKIAEEKKEEIIGIFAKSVAAGGGAAAQAKDELQKLFTGTPEEMNALVAAKKAEL